MNHRIDVPQDNGRVWLPSNGEGVKLTPEVEKWLENLIGYRSFFPAGDLRDGRFTASRPYWMILNGHHSLRKADPTPIFFSDGDHAMLFKLTWL